MVCHHLVAKRAALMQTCTHWCVLLSEAGPGVCGAPRLCCPSWRGPGRAPSAGRGNTSTASALGDPPGSSCSEPAAGLAQRGGRGRRLVGHRLPLGEVAWSQEPSPRPGAITARAAAPPSAPAPARSLQTPSPVCAPGRFSARPLLACPAAFAAPSPPARTVCGVLKSPS